MPRLKRTKAGAPPGTLVGAVVEGKGGELFTWNGRAWRPLETWETPEDFVRWLESTTWVRETDRATVPVPPTVIKRAVRDMRRLLELLERARMTDAQRAMKAAEKGNLSNELEQKNKGKGA
jgi:predicted RNA-binding Zn ribbon-like protein